MFTRFSPAVQGIILGIIGFTCFSAADIGAKWLSQSYSIYQVIVIECSFACAFMLCISPWIGGVRSLMERKNLKFHAARGILNVFINIIIVYCYTQLPLADIYTLLFTVPMISAVMAIPLFKEHVTRARWVAIILGFIGVIITLRPGTEALNPALLLAFGCAFIISLMFIFARYLKDPSILSLGFYPIFTSLVFTLPLMLGDFKPIEPMHFLIFFLQGCAIAGAMTCVSLAYRKAAAALVSPFMYFEMIWALLFGYLLFGDVPDFIMLLGAAIIIASGIYLIESERRLGQNKP